MGVDGSVTVNDYRKSKIRFIQRDDPNFTFLFDELWKLAIQSNDEWFGFHLSKITYIQLAEYDESYQGEYKAHQDVFWMNGDPDYHRKLSCVVQLSDSNIYEGGNLEIYNVKNEIDLENRRSQGTVIFFPSFYYHAVTPVTKGVRFSLTCWFDGPKFR